MSSRIRLFNLRRGLALLASGLLAACGGGSTTIPGPTAPQMTSAACQAKKDVAGFDVVLLIGQSNMSGYGAYIVPGFDTTDPRIQQWTTAGTIDLASDPLQHPDAPLNTGRIGPGMSFARSYLKDLPAARKVLLVPSAFAGTGFASRRWNPGDDLFEAALQKTNAALVTNSSGNCMAAVLWSQGESDVDLMTGADYRIALDRMITTLRSRINTGFGAESAPFLLGQFSPDWTGPTPTAAQQAIIDIIRATPSRIAYTAVVSTTGLKSNVTQGLNGSIHLDAASHRIYGQRFRDAVPAAMANSTAR